MKLFKRQQGIMEAPYPRGVTADDVGFVARFDGLELPATATEVQRSLHKLIRLGITHITVFEHESPR